MDPPFGGLVEVLAHTLKTITKAKGDFPMMSSSSTG